MRIPKYQRDAVHYNGSEYYRYPDHPNPRNRDYYRREKWVNGKSKRIYLHRQVWIDANGDIPKGFHVHHRDGNSLNNDLSNLECLPGGKHISRHRKEELQAPGKRAFLAELANRNRPAAFARLKDPDVQQRLSVRSKRLWSKRTPRTITCEWCQTEVQTIAISKRFCCTRCSRLAKKAEYIRRQVIGG